MSHGPQHSALPFSFHDLSGSDVRGGGGGGGEGGGVAYGPQHSVLPFSYHDYDRSADAEAEQLALHFLDGDVSLVAGGVTWKPAPPGGMAVQTLANLPITVHYLASDKCEPFDILMDEIVFTEAANSSINHYQTKFKMGLAAIQRWLRPGGKGYPEFLNKRTFDAFAQFWSCPWIQITRPGTAGEDKGQNKDEAMVAANIARTRNIWAFQQYNEGATAKAPPMGLRFGDHLFLLSRRVKDQELPIWKAPPRIRHLQDPTWHWEIVPYAHEMSIPPFLAYNSGFSCLWDPNSWSGSFEHLGTYHITLEQERPLPRNYANLARQYLFADTGKVGFEAWKKLAKIELLMKRHG